MVNSEPYKLVQNLILKVSKVEGDLTSESQNDHRKILNLCTMKPSNRSHTSSAVIFLILFS